MTHTVALPSSALNNAVTLFARFGSKTPTAKELEEGIARLLSQCAQHASDPTSSLRHVLSQSFGTR